MRDGGLNLKQKWVKNRILKQPFLLLLFTLSILFIFLTPVPSLAKDGLSGTLTFSSELTPQNKEKESVLFDIDLETTLQANLSFPGITLTTDTALGLAGVEHTILGLTTALGDLTLQDEFWFAAPFDSTGSRLGDPQFVKKRVTLKAFIDGLSFKNLTILEDINFTHPYTSSLKEPKYRWGNILTMTGKLSSEVKVTNLIGICADPDEWNKVKKFKRKGTVCQSDKLELTIERLILKRIHIGGLRLDQTLEMKPQKPFYSKTVLRGDLPILGKPSFIASLATSDPLQLHLSEVTFSLTNKLIYLRLEDKDGDTKFEKTDFRFAFFFNGGYLKGKTLLAQGVGLTFQKLVFGISSSDYSFTNVTKLSGNGVLTLESTKFSLAIPFNPLTFKSQATYTLDGLSSVNISLALNF